MDFLTFLNKYENEDVTVVRDIVESNKKKEETIISEAFKGDYPSKKEALFVLENEFMNESLAPKSVDSDFVTAHIDEIKTKIEQLSEGDIRIIIHNHEDSKSGGGEAGFGEEAKAKTKRGRPKKTAPAMMMDDEAGNLERSAVAQIAREKSIPDDIEPEVITDTDIDVTDEPSEELPELPSDAPEDAPEEEDEKSARPDGSLRWSDIVKKVDVDNAENDALVDELSDLSLDDDELKLATEMAASGEIVEDGGKVAQAAGIISKMK